MVSQESGYKDLALQDEEEIKRAMAQTVQDLPSVVRDGAFSMWLFNTATGSILPPWGTRQRERVLRVYDRMEYNTLWQGAVSNLVKKWCATPWTIDGGRNLTNKYQAELFSAQFGYGWDRFLMRVARDFLRCDGGAYVELIAPGDPKGLPTGPITGLAHLDSYWCYPTGDPEFPVLYWSRYGKLHVMHNSRVIRLVDMEDGDQNNPGYGLCALSRAIAIVERELFMSRYIAANLNDKPSPGMVVATNLNKDDITRAFAQYKAQQAVDAPPSYGNVAWVYSLNPTSPASLENFTFTRPPEKFDYPAYVQIDVDELALAIGVDPQDLRPLQSKNIGSAGQSETLADKAQGKTYGQFLQLLERQFNDHVFPAALTWKFDIADPRQAKQEADLAAVWSGFAASVQVMTPQEKRQLLADQVEAVRKVVTDEAGQLIEVSDDDLVPPDLKANLASKLPPGEGQPAQQATATDSAKPNVAKKDTESDFKREFNAALQAARDKEMKQREYEARLRGLVVVWALKELLAGLAAGGVQQTQLTPAEQAHYVVMLAEQNAYVKEFATRVYARGMSDDEAAGKAREWYNKSLLPFRYYGQESADKDGLYAFVGEDGMESCATCQRLKGTKMRMSEWTARKLRPGIDSASFICGGWQCQHRLQKV